jgi:hypothetical protein
MAESASGVSFMQENPMVAARRTSNSSLSEQPPDHNKITTVVDGTTNSDDYGTSTELSILWRAPLLFMTFISPALELCYAVTGSKLYDLLGQSLFPMSCTTLVLYLFSAPCETKDTPKGHRPRETRHMCVFFSFVFSMWSTQAYGQLFTDPRGTVLSAIFILSQLLWSAPGLMLFVRLLRRKVSRLPQEEIPKYLYVFIIQIGFPSLVPQFYLFLEVLRCLQQVSGLEDAFDECGGITTPVASINMFLMAITLVRVCIAPVTKFQIPKADIISMKMKARLVFQGLFYICAFLCNVFMFSQMGEGRQSTVTLVLFWVANASTIFPAVIEMVYIVFFRKRRGGASNRGRGATMTKPERLNIGSSGSGNFGESVGNFDVL